MADEVDQGVHTYSPADRYVTPQDPLILERLEWFQDQKLAFMMHWGPYSQIGLVESWALSDADADWSCHDVDWTSDRGTFKKQYFELNRTFNPIRFLPEAWADLAADCGFKYLIFTTKHHDGFCMWDTAYSDYRITAPDCPFHTNPRSDVTRHIFDAFRSRGLGIGAYFSKADWRTPYYWNKEFPGDQTARGPSYSPAEHPDLWESFKSFTKHQILELCRHYGKLDILWFDAGWVRGPKQDIDLGGIVDEARKIQPWLLSADRTVGGAYENYITPEQCIPDKPLGVPWESCVTLGTQFSFKYEDAYKSPRELVRLLTDIVSLGGNLALNLGPQPDGRLPAGGIKSLRGLGAWLQVYGEAIYGTRACAPYKTGNLRFTKKGNKTYVIYLYPSTDERPEGLTPPAKLDIPWTGPAESLTFLDTGQRVPFERTREGLRIEFPPGRNPLGESIAEGFAIS
ncbi:MAG: alpha-L-fucosidase [Spirochaetaceae bacterium]|jgi:alpha-L-fucosidase|nr:alpha-L-fucosidase [Spirochaetaceae bacterium]